MLLDNLPDDAEDSVGFFRSKSTRFSKDDRRLG